MDVAKTAYSYIRFSSERQHLGDSLRRQLALAEDYAASHGLRLDTHSYRDMGVSAFKGRNAVEGKLATFLRAVDGGYIPQDSFLLVESLDRLSRSDVDEALELFLSIIRRGITTVTVSDAQEYCTASIKRDRGISLIISITVMMRAHEESAIKSARCVAAWASRTAKGGILTKLCPSWLVYDDGKWRIDRKRAAVVKRIYRLYLEGSGCCEITRFLNIAKVPVMRKAAFWSPGLVTRILSNPAVYGTMQREKVQDIDDYYPAIVSREDFNRARILAKSRSWKGGPKTLYPPNIFIGTAYCGGCGSRFRQISGVSTSYRLRCARAFCDAGCDARTVPGNAAELALMQELLQPCHLEPVRSQAWQDATVQIAILEQRQVAYRLERACLIDAELKSNGVHTARLLEVEVHLLDVRSLLVAQRRLALPKHSADLISARQLCAALTGGKAHATELTQLREKLKVLTNRLLARVEFHPTEPEMTLQYECGIVRTVEYQRPLLGFQPGNTYAVKRWAAADRGSEFSRNEATASATVGPAL